MWELIKINKRNSVLLLAAMGAILLLVGVAAGTLLGGPEGAWIGLPVAAGIWLVMMLISFSSGDRILLASSNAVRVTADVHPMLFNVVEEMTIAANLPKMPDLYIINDPSPNAFATGRNPQNASIAVTAGLLTKLNRDELQGVIAHEMSHIVHRDILFVTLASVILGSVALISNVMMRGMFYGSMGSRRRYSSRSSNQGGAQLILILLAVVLAILAPLFVQLLYFALSRRREYLADAGAVRLTRYPEGLASALEKIAAVSTPVAAANKATAPMYIENPLGGRKAHSLTSTHPPIQERIRILRNMSHGAGFRDYLDSFQSVTHHNPDIPASAFKSEDIPLRQAGVEKQTPAETPKQQARQVGDLMRSVGGYTFLTCPCGLKLKVPPGLTGTKIECPRCGRIVQG
ncbi:MAG: M48 family metallopeptidase [Planctomycetaceae bacterium]|nr:M48 family metallopeptidase [Planctomycetaceae bacterium]